MRTKFIFLIIFSQICGPFVFANNIWKARGFSVGRCYSHIANIDCRQPSTQNCSFTVFNFSAAKLGLSLIPTAQFLNDYQKSKPWYHLKFKLFDTSAGSSEFKAKIIATKQILTRIAPTLQERELRTPKAEECLE